MSSSVAASAARHHKPWSGRNLVVCLDGTNDVFSARNSNVVKLFSVSDSIFSVGGGDHHESDGQEWSGPARQQLLYYDSGVGTGASLLAGVAQTGLLHKLREAVTKGTQMMFAWCVPGRRRVIRVLTLCAGTLESMSWRRTNGFAIITSEFIVLSCG